MNRITYKSASDNFSTTVVENIFINKFMPSADGDYVKVYLYGLKNSQNPTVNPLSSNELACLFGIDVNKVKQAYRYWRDKGIIEIRETGSDYVIYFLDISEKFSQDYEIKINAREISVEDKFEIKTNPSRFRAQFKDDESYQNLIKKAEEMLGGILPFNFINSLDTWINDYSFDYECICFLFEYSLTTMNLENFDTIESKKNYMNKVAENWYSNGVRTVQDAIRFTSEYSRNNKILYFILSELGIKRSPLPFEKELLNKWINEYKFDADMINEGLKRTKFPNLSYLDKILTNWHIKNYQSVDDITNDFNRNRAKFNNFYKTNEFTPVSQEKINAAKEIENDFFRSFKEKALS